MTYKLLRQTLCIASGLDDQKRAKANSRAGPAKVFSGLPQTVRRHELRLIMPLANSLIFEMEKRGEFPPRFNLSPRCVVRDLEDVEARLEDRRIAVFEGRATGTPAPKLSGRRTRPLK